MLVYSKPEGRMIASANHGNRALREKATFHVGCLSVRARLGHNWETAVAASAHEPHVLIEWSMPKVALPANSYSAPRAHTGVRPWHWLVRAASRLQILAGQLLIRAYEVHVSQASPVGLSCGRARSESDDCAYNIQRAHLSLRRYDVRAP